MTKLTIKQASAYILNYHNKRISSKQLQALCKLKRIKGEFIGRMWFISQDELDKFEFNEPGRPNKKFFQE